MKAKSTTKPLPTKRRMSFQRAVAYRQDTGFQGYAPDGVTILPPKKKPRQRELSDEDKQRNRAISQERIKIEHHIGGIKRCQIVMQKFRNRKKNYVDDVMETACGLHNFRLSQRQLKAV